ncbi:MAG: hypothetical protein AB7E80_06735 [Hyphomicrobiaceae bacterium]
MQIQGEITKFRADIGVGVIRAENGRKYRFTPSDIVNVRPDLVGASVDFIAEASRPREIIVLKGSPFAVFGTA